MEFKNDIGQTIELNDTVTHIDLLCGRKSLVVGRVVGFTAQKVKVEFVNHYEDKLTLAPNYLTVVGKAVDLQKIYREERGLE